MSSDLTEAVRRLRGLKEDVERLKAARDEEGELRYLRQITDTTQASDAVDVGPDAAVEDATQASDDVSTDVVTATPGVCDVAVCDNADAG